MSMGANPSLMVGVMADTSALGSGLAQAEAQVRSSAARMGTIIDQRMNQFGPQIIGGLTRGLSAMFALQAADAAIRATSDAFRNDRDIPDAILEAMQKTFSSIPIFGAIQDALIPVGERIGQSFAESFVDTMQREFGFFQGLQRSNRGNEELIANRRSLLAQAQLNLDLPRVESVNTAIGTFKFQTESAQTAEEQLETLRQIRQYMEELGLNVSTRN